jgi:hypothetical protein
MTTTVTSSSSYNNHHAFLVVCTVDGRIVILDAHDGSLACGICSWIPLVGPSSILNSDKEEEEGPCCIVPGLDGRLYVSDDEGFLQPLEITVVDVLAKPVKTCRSTKYCGIVTATKSILLFALDATSGKLVWQQSPDWMSGKSAWNVTLGTFQALKFGSEDMSGTDGSLPLSHHGFLPGSSPSRKILMEDYEDKNDPVNYILPSVLFG